MAGVFGSGGKGGGSPRLLQPQKGGGVLRPSLGGGTRLLDGRSGASSGSGPPRVPPYNAGGGKGGLGGPLKAYIEEDRRGDWYCTSCRERNFMKRASCFKCNSVKPKDGEGLPPPKAPPASGSTLHGMVKSYNKKGFGFIMCLESDIQDIYYTRENVSPRLLHPDMPGEHVSFELGRGPDGRLTAKNIRPFGEDANAAAKGHVFGKAGAKGAACATGEEDRTMDWTCTGCNERNFVKRAECFRCKLSRATGFGDAPTGPPRRASPPPPRRTFSPHAGSRAVRDSLREAALGARKCSGSGSGSSKSMGRTGKRKRKSSSDNSSSSSRKKKKNKRRGKKNKSSSSGSSKVSSSDSDCQMAEPSGAPSVQPSGNPEIDEAKAAALKEILRLSSVEPKEVRMTEWRALLRQWHPDKNPERTEVATAVFQFLQKGKSVVDPA